MKSFDTTTNETVVEQQSFDWFDPDHAEAVEVLSPMFDGIVLKITGVLTYTTEVQWKIRLTTLN